MHNLNSANSNGEEVHYHKPTDNLIFIAIQNNNETNKYGRIRLGRQKAITTYKTPKIQRTLPTEQAPRRGSNIKGGGVIVGIRSQSDSTNSDIKN